MHIRYDDDFVESAVLLCAAGRRHAQPALQIRRFQAARERLYSILDPDDRNAAFFKLHLEWFREWGLEKRIVDVLTEFPLFPAALNVLAFRKARDRKDEAAELYANAETGRNVVVAMRTERFEKDEAVASFLRREMMHVNDMIDPNFGYSRELRARGLNPAQERIVRERYRLLWDVTIDGRLSRANPASNTAREQHQKFFDRAYSFWPEEKRRTVFEELWTNPNPRHDHLLALASDPRDLSHTRAPLPGGSCPLCSFPTFEWANVAALDEATLETLRLQFPAWKSDQGLCQRCHEIYDVLGKHEIPATICI